jgi:hypothetical protein
MSKGLKPRKATVVFLIVTVLSLLVINTGLDALAATVSPMYYSGNDKDLPSPPLGLEFVKFDPPNTGTLKLGDIQVNAEFSDDKKSVDFTSNALVVYVFVKAGDGGYLYTYKNGVYEDSDLYSPRNQDNQGDPANISHVTFYFKPTPTTDPTPTPTPTTTPMPDPTPTPTPTPTLDLMLTPTPTQTPTSTPTPIPTPDPTYTPPPEIEIEDTEIPGGEVIDETPGDESFGRSFWMRNYRVLQLNYQRQARSLRWHFIVQVPLLLLLESR